MKPLLRIIIGIACYPFYLLGYIGTWPVAFIAAGGMTASQHLKKLSESTNKIAA